MKEELKKIVLELREWAEKYDKDYISVAYVNGSLMTNLKMTDEKFDECDLYIMNDEER